MKNYRRYVRLGASLAALAMLAVPGVANAQDNASPNVPDPLIKYDFNDLTAGAAAVTNSGTGGAAFNGIVGNAQALKVGSRDKGGATAQFPGGAKGTGESTMPYIAVPNGVLKDAKGFTVSMWMNWDGKNGDNAKAAPWAWYVGGDKLKKNTTGAFMTPSEGGKLTATSDNADTGKQSKAITASPDADAWQYVTVTQDASTLTVYVNGEKKGSADAAQNFDKLYDAGGTFSALIGRTAFTAKYAPYFGGQIDDFALYNEALTANQVKSLYGDNSSESKGEPESVDPLTQQITQGQIPALPSTVQVKYTNGKSVAHKVTWQDHDWTSQPVGDVTLKGTIDGVPETIVATMTIHVVAKNTEKVIVSQVRQNGTKGYLEVDGQPYYFSGLQNMSEWSRYGNDYKLTYSDPAHKLGASGPYLNNNWDTPILDESWSENLFEKTAAAGFKTIQFMFSWKNIEPNEKGKYDWSVLDRYVQWAQKYDLHIDFVWFGTNTQGGGVMQNTDPGHGFMATVPAWAEAKNADGSFKYFTGNRSGVEKYYVRTPDDKDPASAAAAKELFAAECDAVHAMFNHLAEVDTTHRTILFNVWNEPDSASGFTSFGTKHDMWMGLARNMVNAIKTSNYQVATAMNFHRSYFANDNQRKALLDFANVVDFVGPDSYDNNLDNQVGYLDKAISGHSNQMGWIPEAGGNAGNKTGLVAETIANGGTVSFWELNNALLDANNGFPFYGTTSEGYPLYVDWKLGTIPDMPVASQKMASFNTALNKMNSLVARSEKANVAAFNSGRETSKKTNPDTKYSGTKTVGGDHKVTFATSNGSVGLAIYDPGNGQTYVATDSLKSAQTFNVGEGVVASSGSFDANGNWVQTASLKVADNGDVQVKPGELVRIGKEMKADKSKLGDLVGEAIQLEESAYTVESWKPFSEAFAKAQKVNQDENATQEEVDEAYQELKSAIDGLQQKVATKLEVTAPTKTKYTLGEPLDTKGMTVTVTNNDGTVEELTGGYTLSGYDASKTGKQKITVTYGEGDKALTATFEVTVSAPVDKSGLTAVLDSAASLTESDYTDESWQALSAAVKNAKTLLDDTDVTQEQISDAQVALFKAAVGLERRGAASGGAESPKQDGDSGSSGSTGTPDKPAGSGSQGADAANRNDVNEGQTKSDDGDSSTSGIARTGASIGTVAVAIVVMIIFAISVVVASRTRKNEE